MDLERLHKIDDNKLLSLMTLYFKTIHDYGSVSRDETINFLYYYNEYILRQNGIDLPNFKMIIHHDYTSDYNVSAFMYQIKDVFHVHVQKRLLQDIIDKKKGAFIELLLDAGHEFQHIVQYLLDYKGISDYETQKYDIEIALEEIPKIKPHKKLRNSLNQHNDSLNYLHPIEIDADQKSYRYLLNLLDTIMSYELDEDFLKELSLYKKMTKIDKKYRTLELHKVKLTDDYSKRCIKKSLDSEFSSL